MNKKGLILLLLLLPLWLLAESFTYNFSLNPPSVISDNSLLEAGYGLVTAPGYLRLPYKTVNILLPAGSELTSQRVLPSSTLSISSQSPQRNGAFFDGDSRSISRSSGDIQTRINFLGLKKWGDLRYASYRILPAVYQGGAYEWTSDYRIELELRIGSRTQSRIPGTFQDHSFFINKSELLRWYQPSQSKDLRYLVISNSSLLTAVQPLINYRNANGFQVFTANIDYIQQNSPGASVPEKIQNFLISEYNIQAFDYLLLVGDIDVIPTAMLTPEPDGFDTVPSDFYYSDISSVWDTDGDSRLGEYSAAMGLQDWGMDFSPEIMVGRISSSVPAEVTAIANRIVAFESTNAAWKNNALLPAAFLNYANEPEAGFLQTDGAGFMEYVKSTVLQDMQTTTLYEQLGFVPSYPSTQPLDYNGLKTLLSSQSYGLVNWSAHGSATSSSRKVWMVDDNGNNFPDSWEMQWENMVNKQSFNNLQNSDGCVLFAASCYNGMIDNDSPSLGEYSLIKKTVGSIAATRTGWYKIGWLNPGWGGLASYNYHWLENYVNNHYSVGTAHAYTNLLHTQIYLFGDPVDSGGIIWPELQNVYTYLLYGDPAVGHQNAPLADNTFLIWEPNGTQGLRLQNALNAREDCNVVYTDMLITNPDIDQEGYLNQFDAIFCLLGFGESAFQLNSSLPEYTLLNDYLDLGGSIYLEGEGFWDAGDSFWSKFGISSPFNHLAVIEALQTVSNATPLTWGYSEEFVTNALMPVGTAGSLIQTDNQMHNNDIVGIFNSPPDSYRSYGSSFPMYLIIDSGNSFQDFVDLMVSTLVESGPSSSPELPLPQLSLKAYPNPFNPLTNIDILLPRAEKLSLGIYNLRGQRVSTLADGNYQAGNLSFAWDGSDANCRPLASGIYLLKAVTPSNNLSHKLILLK